MNSKHKHTHKHEGNCRELLGSLSDYVDGGLNEEMCARLEEHMAGCENCRVVVDTLRRTVSLYHEISDTEPVPEGVRQRLFKRLNLEDLMDEKEGK